MTMFFQLAAIDTEIGEVKVERWGCVSLERMPKEDDVRAVIPAEHARGEFVQWESLVIFNGAPRVNYYAAFEFPLEGQIAAKGLASKQMEFAEVKP